MTDTASNRDDLQHLFQLFGYNTEDYRFYIPSRELESTDYDISPDERDRYTNTNGQFLQQENQDNLAKWMKFFRNIQTLPSKQEWLTNSDLKELVKQGIPFVLRGPVWYHLLEGPKKVSEHPALYRETLQKIQNIEKNPLIPRPELQVHVLKEIQKDVHRGFFAIEPDRYSIEEEQKIENERMTNSVRNILFVFFMLKHDDGFYFQGLHMFVGIILSYVLDEEKAYWMLDTIYYEVIHPSIRRAKFDMYETAHIIEGLSYAKITNSKEMVQSNMETGKFTNFLTILASQSMGACFVKCRFRKSTILHIFDLICIERDIAVYKVILVLVENVLSKASETDILITHVSGSLNLIKHGHSESYNLTEEAYKYQVTKEEIHRLEQTYNKHPMMVRDEELEKNRSYTYVNIQNTAIFNKVKSELPLQ